MPTLKAEDVEAAMLKGGSARAEAPTGPRFSVGDCVTTHSIHPRGHTRLPRYARKATGVVDRHHGSFIFPDSHAAGEGKQPQHLYSVRFEAEELWGADAQSRSAVYIDLFESYLDPA